MTGNNHPDPGAELSPQAIADYLLAHPDFFRQRRKLLTQLSIPHPSGGAVSLLERQVEVLRQKNHQLERRLVDWMEVARENDHLLARLHNLATALLESSDASARLSILKERLCAEFEISAVDILIYLDAPLRIPADIRRIARDTLRLDGLAQLLHTHPVCRELSQSRRQSLFPGNTQLASAAFVPLGPNGDWGFIALASDKAGHFHPGLDTTYLTRLGTLASAAVSALRQ